MVPGAAGSRNPAAGTEATGCFETMRVYGGRVFLLDRHLVRLGRAIRALGLGDAAALRERARGKIDDALERTGAVDAGLRLTVSHTGHDLPSIRVEIFEVPYPGHAPPATLIRAEGRRESRDPWTRYKLSGRAQNLAAREAAKAAGAMDAIFLNERGEVAECASSNIFVVAGGALRTPPIRAGTLPGIARWTVLALARRLGIRASKCALHPEDLTAADEVFITSSLKEVIAVGIIEGARIGGGSWGAVAIGLRDAYREWANPRAG